MSNSETVVVGTPRTKVHGAGFCKLIPAHLEAFFDSDLVCNTDLIRLTPKERFILEGRHFKAKLYDEVPLTWELVRNHEVVATRYVINVHGHERFEAQFSNYIWIKCSEKLHNLNPNKSTTPTYLNY